MTPLSFNRKWLYWLSVYCDENDKSQGKTMLRFAFTACIILINTIALMSSVTFFMKYMQINLEAALYAFSLIIAFLGCLYIILITLFMRQKITTIFSNLSKIYESSKIPCFVLHKSQESTIELIEFQIFFVFR